MNSLPRLFQNPSWEMIASLSGNELFEVVMLALMSVGLIAAVCWGIYSALFRRDRGQSE